MKTKILILLAIPILVIFSATQSAHGLWLPQSPEELLEKSQLIFVGTITSVNSLEFERSSSHEIEEDGVSQTIVENYTLVLDEYTVSVEEFVKNQQDVETVTVRQPTTSIPGRIVPHGGFDIGDRVLFYIETFDGTNTYSKESFRIPEHCDAAAVVQKPRMIGGDLKMIQEGMEKQDSFTAKSPVMFIAQMDLGTLFGASLEYDVYISKQVGKIYKDIVFHEKITADAKPCEWLSVAEWEFTPDAGNYLVNGRIYKENSNLPVGNQFFSVFAESPLKQFKSGIPIHKIQCNDSLVLVTKNDGSPACVKEQKLLKLVERKLIITSKVERDLMLDAGYKPFPGVGWVQGVPQKTISSEPEPVTSLPGLQVDVTGQQQVRRGTTHDIVVDVFRDATPVPDAFVRITIEDYSEDIIRDFKGRTDDSGRFVFSWEIPKSFDDIKTLLAYVDVTDDISAKTILFKFQVYCIPGETGCKVEGN